METAWKSDFLLWSYCDFMFSNGRHFEVNIKTDSYKTQFISQKHAYPNTSDEMWSLLLCK